MDKDEIETKATLHKYKTGDPWPDQYFVLLHGDGDYLQVSTDLWKIGHIFVAMNGLSEGRPDVIEGILACVNALKGSVVQVKIFSADDIGQLNCRATFKGNGGLTTVDVLPTDAIALAIRAEAPILVDRSLAQAHPEHVTVEERKKWFDIEAKDIYPIAEWLNPNWTSSHTGQSTKINSDMIDWVNAKVSGLYKVEKIGFALLLTCETNQEVPISFGESKINEAYYAFTNKVVGRPILHKAILEVICGLGGKLSATYIYGRQKGKTLIGFAAHIVLESKAEEFKIDIPAIDALSLALLSNTDIFVDRDISQEYLNRYFARNPKRSWTPFGEDKSWPPRVD